MTSESFRQAALRRTRAVRGANQTGRAMGLCPFRAPLSRGPPGGGSLASRGFVSGGFAALIPLPQRAERPAIASWCARGLL